MRQIAFSLLSICFIAGCSQNGTGGSSDLHTEVPSGGSILSALRPRFEGKPGGAPASALMKVSAGGAQGAAGGAANANGSVLNLGGLGRVLPKTSSELLAPPAEELAGPVVSTANAGPAATNDWATQNAAAVVPTAPPVASYGGNYNAGAVPPPPAGALSGGMVPPPPAITLSTQAQTMAFAGGMPNEGGMSPYNNPYLNPYGIPYPTSPSQMPGAPNVRPAGSPFSTGNGNGGGGRQRDDDEDAPKPKKAANFTPITPTGMESRSAYKQRDDLKVLWKGVLGNAADIKAICRDDKVAADLNKIDVSLPSGEAAKGSISVSQRMVDGIFKSNNIADKRLVPSVKKAEMDMVQAYYRYLYSYNKFALAQQTVLARKQEAETADSASESQRAAADLAQAQTEAESTKDDMHSAQSELASLTGAAAARTIIGRVSGITPSLESIAQSIESAPDDSQASGRTNPIGSLFHHKGKGSSKGTETTAKAEKTAKPEKGETAEDAEEKPTKVAKADTKADSKKDKKGKKDKVKGDSKKDGDLAPAPEAAASKPDSDGGETASRPKGGGDVSFQLTGVSVTPRKSILAVTIHNSGSNNFSFSPDVISISDGSHKLSEAAVRADFDQTLVQPNGEVKGTITIYGRPWNERLAVNLPDGSKNIPMRR